MQQAAAGRMRSNSLKIEEDRGWKEGRMNCEGHVLSSDSGGGFSGRFLNERENTLNFPFLFLCCFCSSRCLSKSTNFVVVGDVGGERPVSSPFDITDPLSQS